MIRATKLSVSSFGTILGIAGLEHGVGEILQGNSSPDGFFFRSWANNELYNILDGEPAMTIFPFLPFYIIGMLAIISSSLLIIWSILYIDTKHGGLGLILLSILQLLTGGGLAGPVLIGIVISWAASKINSQWQWLNNNLSKSIRISLAQVWPYSYSLSIISWFSLWPGLIILVFFTGIENSLLVIFLTFLSFGTLLFTLLSGFAYDSVYNPTH